MIVSYTPLLCAVGCILKMPGTPIFLCGCTVCAGRKSSFENSPKYRGNSAQFSLEMVQYRLARDMSLCAGHDPGWVMTSLLPPLMICDNDKKLCSIKHGLNVWIFGDSQHEFKQKVGYLRYD